METIAICTSGWIGMNLSTIEIHIIILLLLSFYKLFRSRIHTRTHRVRDFPEDRSFPFRVIPFRKSLQKTLNFIEEGS